MITRPGSTLWRSVVAAALDRIEAVTVVPVRRSERAPDPARAVEVVRQSLEDPVGARPLSELLVDARRVAVVLPDARDGLRDEVVHAVMQHIDAFAAPDTVITAVVAARNGAVELCDDRGEASYIDAVRSYDVRVMAAEPGGPNEVHPMVARADLVIALHRLQLRYDLGFGGGPAGTVVGCGGPRTWLRLERLLAQDGCGAEPCMVGTHAAQLAFADDLAVRPTTFAVYHALSDRSGNAYISGDPLEALALLTASPGLDLRVSSRQWCGAVAVVDDEGEGAWLESALESYLLLALQDASPLVPGAPVVLAATCSGGVAPGEAGGALLAALRGAALTQFSEPLRLWASRIATRVARANGRHPLVVLAPGLESVALAGAPFVVARDIEDALQQLAARRVTLLANAGLSVLVTRSVTGALPVLDPDLDVQELGYRA